MSRHSRWAVVDLQEPSPNRTLRKHESAQRFGCFHATLPKRCMPHGDELARHGVSGASILRQCDQVGDRIATPSTQSKCSKRARQSKRQVHDHESCDKARDACVSPPLPRSQVPLTSPPNEPTSSIHHPRNPTHGHRRVRHGCQPETVPQVVWLGHPLF
jgi:hypothetical protein